MANTPAAGEPRPSRRRRVGQRSLLVLGGLVVGLGLAELGAVWCDDVRPYLVELRSPEQSVGVLNEPNTTLRWTLDPEHPPHNSWGVRDEEFTAEPAAGVTRIAVVGDSIPYGVGVLSEESYPEVLEQQLREAGGEVEVINAGVPAYTGLQVGEFFHRRVLDWSPALVLISVASNDLDSMPVILHEGGQMRWAFYEDGPEMQKVFGGLPDSWHLALWRHSHLYRLLVRALLVRRLGEKAGESIFVAGERCIAALVSIYQTCRERGIPAVAVLVPLLVDTPDPMWAPRMARLADGLAAAGVPQIDLRDRLATTAQPLSALRVAPEDPWHLSIAGHRRVAEVLLPELQARGLVGAQPSTPSPAPVPGGAAPPPEGRE